jgi:CheY-like chemotaxis protein
MEEHRSASILRSKTSILQDGVIEQQRSILIVEDDTDIREALQELLEDHGHRVLSAEHGQRALEILRSEGQPPRLILLDISMPVMDGFAFREAQLADPALASVPVIVMTADGRVEESRKRIGCTHALRKPMEVQQLLALLAAYD